VELLVLAVAVVSAAVVVLVKWLRGRRGVVTRSASPAPPP